MSLQIRRGPSIDRLSITPVEGELIYDVNEKALYVGDGSTVGGVATAPTSVANIETTVAALFTSGVHSNVSYQYDSLANRINSSVDLTNYNNVITANGFKGSVFAYDDTLLVDGLLKGFQLDGTVRSNIVPAANDAYDLGNSLSRFRDLYLSGNTLYLGDAVINAVGPAVNLPAGSTVNGAPISSGSGIVDGQAYKISIIGDDSSVIVDSVNNTVNASGGIFGTLTGDVVGGSVFGQDSSLLVDAINGQIVGDINARLGGNLNTTGYSIVNNANLFVVTGGYTQFGSSLFDINGNVLIRRGQYTGDVSNGLNGFSFLQHHNNERADRVIFGRSRGTAESPLPQLQNDWLGELAWIGWTAGSTYTIGASIRVIVEEDSVGAGMPTTMVFRTCDNTGVSRGAVKIDSQGRLMARSIVPFDNSLQMFGDVVGSLFSDDSTRIIDGTDGSITAGSFVQFASLTTAQRDALSAVNGMVIYNTSNNKFEGRQNGVWINLDDGNVAGS